MDNARKKCVDKLIGMIYEKSDDPMVRLLLLELMWHLRNEDDLSFRNRMLG